MGNVFVFYVNNIANEKLSTQLFIKINALSHPQDVSTNCTKRNRVILYALY